MDLLEVCLFHVYIHRSDVLFFTHFCPLSLIPPFPSFLHQGPTLVDALASLKSGYTEADVKILLERLLDAVHYMHLNGVTHRDLKLENLMLASKDGSDLRTVTVIDFGLAKAARARDRMEDACGTLWYYAPELVKGIPFLPVVDEWAVGVCMHVLLSGEFPFDHEDEDELEDLIIAADMSKIRCIHNSPEDDDADDDEEDEDDGGIVIGEEDEAVKSRGGGATSSSSSSSPPPSLWSKISAEARDLLLGLLNPAPMKRLTAQAALGHSFFSGSSSGDSVTLWHGESAKKKKEKEKTRRRRLHPGRETQHFIFFMSVYIFLFQFDMFFVPFIFTLSLHTNSSRPVGEVEFPSEPPSPIVCPWRVFG
jgi:serine/threonine protein kinase